MSREVCDRCGKFTRPDDVHTCTPKALVLANSAHLGYRVGWQREAAAELRRLHDEVRMLQEQNTELDRKLADYEPTSLELCDQCGWRFMLPGDGCLKCNAGPYKLSCGCKSKWLGLPAFWGTSSREGENAVAHGVVCERHWHEWGCWSPELEDLNIIKRTLTDEVIADLWYKNGTHHHHFARAVERWLKGEE